ncbi:hypothetical protein BC941DRAFT_9467 [Chlamydoabsidia padenii]|nr:hypothetical protein BC941DRAFT_9467 [Chlamydoabsidia padenii]
MVLERQNQQLQQNVDDLVDQMNRRQTEILQLEEQSEALEAQMDTLWTALDRQKEQQAEYNDMKETMVSARQELRSHMDDFQHTHHRIMQRYLGQGSFAWVIEHSFQRLHRFQDRHTLDRQGRGVVYLTTGLLVLILALLVGYFIL